MLFIFVSAVAYVVYAINGIVDQVERRNSRSQNLRLMAGTATQIASRVRLADSLTDHLADSLSPTRDQLSGENTSTSNSIQHCYSHGDNDAKCYAYILRNTNTDSLRNPAAESDRGGS